MKESEKMDLASELKKVMEHESDGDTNWSWCTWNGSQELGKKTGGIGDQRLNQESS